MELPAHAFFACDLVAVTAGGSHSLAIVSDGAVWAWGDNRNGQLGDGSNVDSHVPVRVRDLTDVTAVAGGAYHSLALRGDGTVWAWGLNQWGELGDGTNDDSSVPVRVAGLTGVRAVAAGGDYSLALLDDGTVWSWGLNEWATLGNGTTADSSLPVRVAGLTGVGAIAAGLGHAHALAGDGTVWSWGYNWWGELGDGSPVQYLPSDVEMDAVPRDQGNVLRAVKRPPDVELLFAGAPASGWRLYRGPGKKTIGATPLLPDVESPAFTDPGAVLAAGDFYYDLRGLSPCTSTPGP